MPDKLKKLLCDTSLVSIKRAQLYTRAVGVEGPGAEGTCNPVFSSSVNSILNRGWPWGRGGGRLCSPHYDVTPPDFQTFLRTCSQFAISITIIRVAIQSILMILMGVRLPSMNDTNASRGLLVTFKRTRLFGQ